MKWFVDQMLPWFSSHGRDLLWRHDVTPYRVWVSEVMLQQTQVATVTPFFERWMTRFPTLESLANAEESEVLAYWEGLGYYRRARYLHQGAKYILTHHDGVFPKTVAELRAIPGIGAYTAGAIASIAFGQNVPAIDGNVERVLGRYFAIRGDLKKGEPRQTLEKHAQSIASLGHASQINQAMMDLGASLCGKIACCDTCPLAKRCQACIQHLTDAIPQKSSALEKSKISRAALVLVDASNHLLLARRRAEQLLGGLWTFPMIDVATTDLTTAQTQLLIRTPRVAQWNAWLHDHGIEIPLASAHPTGTWIHHVFTHIDMHVTLDVAKSSEVLHPPQLLPDSEYDAFDSVTLTSSGLDMTNHPSSTLMKKLLRAYFHNE